MIDEKKYISASRAAKLTGYAMDYIGQLARNHKVDSKMIGRSWYVVEESLLGYKREVLDVAFSGKNSKKNRSITKRKKFSKRVANTQENISKVCVALIPWIAPLEIVAEAVTPVVLESAVEVQASPRAPMSLETVELTHVEEPVAALVESVMEEQGEISAVQEFVDSLNAEITPHTSIFVTHDETKDDFVFSVVEASKLSTSEMQHNAHAPVVAEIQNNFEIGIAETDSFEDLDTESIINIQIPETTGVFVAPLSPYYKFNLLKKAGKIIAVSAFALSFAVITSNSDALYQASEQGVATLSSKVNSASLGAEKILARSPLYLHAGVAAVERSMAINVSPDLAGTSKSSPSDETFFVRLGALGSRISSLFDRTTLALTDRAVSIFGKYLPRVDVHATKLAIEASGKNTVETNPNSGSAPRRADAMAIVPSTGNAAEDRKIQTYIKETFSDEVHVVTKNDDGTGVLQPVFKSGKPDKYLYVLVPLHDGS